MQLTIGRKAGPRIVSDYKVLIAFGYPFATPIRN
jgi:hypothetical protein